MAAAAAEHAARLRCADADRMMKEADKATKKTLFQWKPDFDAAAQGYDKAASIYRAQQQLEKASYAYEKAGEAHAKVNLHGLSAKAFENVALTERDMKHYDRAVEFFKKCSESYLLADQPDRAAEALVKGAKLMQDDQDDQAVALYKEAIRIYETNDRHHMMGDTWRHAVACMVKSNHIGDAIELFEGLFGTFEKLEQATYWHRACLSIVILKLYLNDFVAADRAFIDYCGSVGGFAMSDEGQAAELLLQYYNSGEVEEVAKLVVKQPFSFLENRVARLAKELEKTVAKKEGLAPMSRVAPAAYYDGGHGNEDDDTGTDGAAPNSHQPPAQIEEEVDPLL